MQKKQVFFLQNVTLVTADTFKYQKHVNQVLSPIGVTIVTATASYPIYFYWLIKIMIFWLILRNILILQTAKRDQYELELQASE
jgi:hypothetical protein